MDWETWLEKQEQLLARDLENGSLSNEEYRKEMRELQREYRDCIEQEAEEAYDRVMENYGYGY
jgi:hypothetical protein